MPIIGSLNGASVGGWTRYAKSMQDAGVDAMELNIYFIPTDPADVLETTWKTTTRSSSPPSRRP